MKKYNKKMTTLIQKICTVFFLISILNAKKMRMNWDQLIQYQLLDYDIADACIIEHGGNTLACSSGLNLQSGAGEIVKCK